jgi:hypothetical protein
LKKKKLVKILKEKDEPLLTLTRELRELLPVPPVPRKHRKDRKDQKDKLCIEIFEFSKSIIFVYKVSTKIINFS